MLQKVSKEQTQKNGIHTAKIKEKKEAAQNRI